MGKPKSATTTAKAKRGAKSSASALSRVKLKFEDKKGKLQVSRGFNPKYPGGSRSSHWASVIRRPFLQLRQAVNRAIAFLQREFREW